MLASFLKYKITIRTCIQRFPLSSNCPKSQHCSNVSVPKEHSDEPEATRSSFLWKKERIQETRIPVIIVMFWRIHILKSTELCLCNWFPCKENSTTAVLFSSFHIFIHFAVKQFSENFTLITETLLKCLLSKRSYLFLLASNLLTHKFFWKRELFL